MTPSVDLADLHARQRKAVLHFAKEPRTFEERGIVTSVFDREFASCWVLLSELARLGVTAPIEAFHLPGELSNEYAALLPSLGLNLRLRTLHDQTNAFGVKVWSIWRSSFREVLWLDSDNFPIRDPTFLFDDAEFRAKGSLFWRDVSGADRARYWHEGSNVWPIFNVPANDAEEFESGQLLIDKERRWAEIALTLHFVSIAIYRRCVLGEKDMFRLAWQNLATARKKSPPVIGYLRDPALVPYGFMPFGPFHKGLPNDSHKWGGGTVMVQRDRDGRALFNHRNLKKFRIGQNSFNADIENENFYHAHVERLRELLAG